MCGMIADHYRDAGISLVVGPAMGGVILAYETARQLGVHSIYAEKDGNGGLMFEASVGGQKFTFTPSEGSGQPSTRPAQRASDTEAGAEMKTETRTIETETEVKTRNTD